MHLALQTIHMWLGLPELQWLDSIGPAVCLSARICVHKRSVELLCC
jgi:hypothetical protein